MTQLLTEGVLLSFAGGAVGLAVAWILIRIAPSVVPAGTLPGPVGLNLPAAGFTLAVSLLTCMLFGLAPGLLAVRADPQLALRDSRRGLTGGRNERRFGEVIVASEAALAIILLVSSGLMIESLRTLLRVDPGFDPKDVVTVPLFLPAAKYNSEQALRFYQAALERISVLPGVKSATLGTSLPLYPAAETRFDLEDSPPRGQAEQPSVAYAAVDAGYFRTLGIPLKQGRLFAPADNEHAPPVAIISEALKSRYFPNENPLGRHIRLNRLIRSKITGELVRPEIVGVVGDVKLADLSAAPKPFLYVPHPQNPWSQIVWFAVRPAFNPMMAGAAVRRELMSLDHELPIDEPGTLEQVLASQSAVPRFQTGLMNSFALVALGLAAVGLYGVNAYAVTQKRNEIGVRMALGATRGQVLREVLAQGMRPAVIGMGFGLAGAATVAFVMRSVLVGASAIDPLAFVEAALLLGAAAACACYLPARRATRIDPAVVLRND